MTNETPGFKPGWVIRALVLTVVASTVLSFGEARGGERYRGPWRGGAWRAAHQSTGIRVRTRMPRSFARRGTCPPATPRTPEETALEHPSEPTVDEVAWFRAHPEARARLLERLDDPELDDNASARLLLWSLLKEQALMPSEIARVLDQAFHLIPRRSGGLTYWVFERRTAPEFVYITPQFYVYLRDGVVVHAQSGVAPGNGVEVHAESSGRGPFAGQFPVDAEASLLADEFRFYYRVFGATTMPWLEGFEGYLQVKLQGS